MDENKKYEIIKKLVDTNGNKKMAELKIECTGRHINRLITGYKQRGKAFDLTALPSVPKKKHITLMLIKVT